MVDLGHHWNYWIVMGILMGNIVMGLFCYLLAYLLLKPVRQIVGLKFAALYWVSASFICLCGTTHLVSVLTAFHGWWNWLSMLSDVAAGIMSVVLAIVGVRYSGRVMAELPRYEPTEVLAVARPLLDLVARQREQKRLTPEEEEELSRFDVRMDELKRKLGVTAPLVSQRV